MSFANLRFLSKLTICFGIVLVCTMVASLALFSVLNAAETAAARNDKANRALLNLGQAATAHLDEAHTARGFLITKVDRHARLYGEAVKLFAERIAAAQAEAAGFHEAVAALKQVEAASLAWRTATGDPMVKLAQTASTYDQAIEVAKSPQSSALQQAFREAFEKAQGRLTALVEETGAQGASMVAWSKLVHGGGTAAAVFAALAAGFLLAHTTAKPILRLAGTMSALADGDHGVEVPFAMRRDEIGHMARSVVTFRSAAVQRQRAEAEATSARQQADDVRASHEAERSADARSAREACDALAAGLDALARGDLSRTIDHRFADELDALRTAYNATIEGLRETMATIDVCSSSITSGVDEISVASMDLSRRTEQQAAALEQAAVSIEQTAEMVRRTATGAGRAHEIVVKARSDVQQGGEVVTQTITAMQRIEEASKKIHGFIGIIDEIAFQTNLLALNAGVEAARAGEAGRGFAVVASEVRALAQRSATAAQEVKDLVAVSERLISDGVTLVGETGAALGRVTSQITGIDKLVSEIAVGSREQSGGLDQLNQAVRQIDDGTQQNAAMAEQTTAAVQSVAHEARRMSDLMRAFDLGEIPLDTSRRAA